MPSPRRTPHRGRLLLVFLILSLAVLMTGCGSSGSSNSSGQTPTDGQSGSPHTTAQTDPTHEAAPAPQVGVCRRLTYGDISRFSNDGQVVACDGNHTAYTFTVDQLPKDISFKGVDIGNDAVQEKASDLCRADFADYVGGSSATRALSRLSVTYFLPTQQDFDLGSRWVRCDVVALQAAKVLAPLPEKVKGFNEGDHALDDYGVCSHNEPGTADGMLVMCNQDHDFRALTALRLGSDSAAYPGISAVRTDGQQRCSDYIAKALGLEGGFSYAWTYPSSQDWANGQRFGFCWHKTSR